MKLIDFRYRPNTKEIITGFAEGPIMEALLAVGLSKEEFYARAKSMPDIIAELKANQVLQCVMVGRDAGTRYPAFASNNDAIKAFMDACPELLTGFAGVDPYKGMAGIRQLALDVEERGFRGAAIDPPYAQLPASHAKFYPIYTKCCELDIPLVITSGPIRYGADTLMDYARPNEIDIVAKDFPELKIVVSHGGWPYVQEMIGVAYRNRNVYVELSEFEKNTGSSAYFEAARSDIKGKLLFASAHPAVHYMDAAKLYQTFGMDAETLEDVMWRNAARLLGMPMVASC